MCGIVAVHSYGGARVPVDVERALAIRDHMAARGPDGAGVWVGDDGRVALAHRRLAIIGLGEQGAQPMALAGPCRPASPLVVTFNGELYDHVSVRAALERRGHVFTTATDTEVLLHLYEEYGTDLVHHVRGMFAFALWDGRRRRLVLARDPYGIKPLYYADDGSTVRVASQARALVEAGGVSAAVDPAAPAALLVLGSIPEPRTAWAAVRAVPAGSTIVVDDAGVGDAKVWCRPEDVMAAAAGGRPSGADPDRLVAEGVGASVAAHLVADVPVGVFLSAGIDSGAVLAMASAHAGRLVAVTLGFDEYAGTADDEVPLAAEVAARYDAEHVVARTSAADVRAALPALFASMDQPSVDGVNTWLVSRATARAGVKVVLSGTGGDELLGGYATFSTVPRMARALGLVSRVPSADRLIRAGAALAGARLSPKTAGLLELGTSLAGVWGLRHAIFLPSELPAVMGREQAAESLAALDLDAVLAPELAQGQRGPVAVGMMESAMFLRNQLLRDTDWASMAHSVEVRLPLVDAQLLRRLGPDLSALMTDRTGKRALGASPQPPLPDTVVGRAKTGFSTPLGQWITSWPETDGWRRVPLLRRAGCPWARRWAFTVAERFDLVSSQAG